MREKRKKKGRNDKEEGFKYHTSQIQRKYKLFNPYNNIIWETRNHDISFTH